MTRSLLVLLALTGIAHAGEDSAVRATWARYRKAALAGDGVTAAHELAADTLRHYAELRTAALVAPDIHGLPLADKLLVVRMRHELTVEELAALDGPTLAARMIARHWVDLNDGATLGAIHVHGDTAEAALLGEAPIEPTLVFRREPSGWHLERLGESARRFAIQRERSGLSEDAFVLQTVGRATGRTVAVGVWKAPIEARPRTR